MKNVELNRECPFCHKDCGATSQNYPFDTMVEHECVHCKSPLANEFKYPDFTWKIRNWHLKKTKKEGVRVMTFFKKWGQKVKV
jgi:hypothetical protein